MARTCSQTGPSCSGEAKTSLRPQKTYGKNTKMGKKTIPATAPVRYRLTRLDMISLASTDLWETACLYVYARSRMIITQIIANVSHLGTHRSTAWPYETSST